MFCENQKKLVRVEKIVRITYPYTLTVKSDWLPFPDMSLTVDLKFSQEVKYMYNINFVSASTNWLCFEFSASFEK